VTGWYSVLHFETSSLTRAHATSPRTRNN